MKWMEMIIWFILGTLCLQIRCASYPSCSTYEFCVLINYFGGPHYIESTFLKCSGQMNTYIRSNSTVILNQRGLTEGCVPQCTFVHDNDKSKFCNNKVRKTLFLKPGSVITALYPMCKGDPALSRWFPCDNNMQSRFQSCKSNGQLRMFQIRLCQKDEITSITNIATVNPSITTTSQRMNHSTLLQGVTSQPSEPKTVSASKGSNIFAASNQPRDSYFSCSTNEFCVLFNYYGVLNLVESTFLKCSGQMKTFIPSNDTLIINQRGMKMGCYPRCNFVHDNDQSNLCPGNKVRKRSFLYHGTVITALYPLCEGDPAMSRWFPCENNMQSRFQSCKSNGTLRMFQIRLCQKDDSTSITKIATVVPSTHTVTSSSNTKTKTLLISVQATTQLHTTTRYGTMKTKISLQSVHHSTSSRVMTLQTSVSKTTSTSKGINLSTSNTLTKDFSRSTVVTATERIYQSVHLSVPILDFSRSTVVTATGRIYQSVHPSVPILVTRIITTGVAFNTTAAPTSKVACSSSVNVPHQLFCPYETIGDDAYKGIYEFTATEANKEVIFTCKYGSRPSQSNTTTLSRKCTMDQNGHVHWQNIDLDKCAAKSSVSNKILDVLEMPVTKETVDAAVDKLVSILLEPGSIKMIQTFLDVDNIVAYLEKVVTYAAGNVKVTHKIFESIQLLMNIKTDVLLLSKLIGIVSEYLNQLAEGLLKVSGSVNFSSTNLAFAKTTPSVNEDLVIAASISNGVQAIQFSNNKTYGAQHAAEIRIPKSIWKYANVEEPLVYSYSFVNDTLFRTKNQQNKMKKVVGSAILSATIYNVHADNLPEDITLEFLTSRKGKVDCSFWDDKNGTKLKHWSTRGCKLASVDHLKDGSNRQVTCKCNHLTNFAILLSPDAQFYDSRVLDAISLIGSITSIVALSATILIYIGLREVRRTIPNMILLNFCISLNLLLLTFVIGTKKTNPLQLCHNISIVIHYFTLTTFFWMSVECISLYRNVTNFRKKNFGKKHLWFSAFLAWGLPGIIAAVTSTFTKKHFEHEQKFCIVSGDEFFVSTLLPVLVVLIVNFILFVPIIRKINSHLSKKEKFQDTKDYKRRVRVTLSCIVLLGLTWILGVFAVGKVGIPVQWVFAILNSLQGLFIFICHVILKYEVQQAVRRFFGYNYQKQRLSISTSKTSTIRLKTMF